MFLLLSISIGIGVNSVFIKIYNAKSERDFYWHFVASFLDSTDQEFNEDNGEMWIEYKPIWAELIEFGNDDHFFCWVQGREWKKKVEMS